MGVVPTLHYSQIDVDKRIQRMVNMDNARCYHVNTTAEGGIQLHFAPIKPDDKAAHKNAEGGRIGSRKFLRKLSEEVSSIEAHA